MDAIDTFRVQAHQIVDWIADYYACIEEYPVKSQVKPGSIFSALPELPPENPEKMEQIFGDFETILMPGITHWQSPSFFAYFPANTSFPSLLAEMIASALGAQCMKWETSPAAAELEEVVMCWLRKMIGLPESFAGVIQDSASTATLCALLTAREKATGFRVNREGYKDSPVFRVYCSSEAHSSIEKAVKIAGMGKNNLVKIDVDDRFSMIPALLEEAVLRDLHQGYTPLCVVAALGTTGSTAVDPLIQIADISSRYNLWLHVDAAFSGSALILPEYRSFLKGVEHVDSFVFNPHKWLLTHFDCSAYFVKDPESLVNTFKLVPEYLKSQTAEHVNDYSNWGIQLGRRFRALKLWFVIRSFGVSGLQKILRNHISMARQLKSWIEHQDQFELMAPVEFSVVCFRFHPQGLDDQDRLNRLNEKLLLAVNETGKMYITHTKLKGNYVLRMVTAQANTELRHVQEAWARILATASRLFEPEND